MAVYKRYLGKKITAKHPAYKTARWWMSKRIRGKRIHEAIPEAQTKEQAEKAERRIIEQAFNRRYGITQRVSFVEFAHGPYTRYFQSVNTNIGAKRLYVQKLCAAFKEKMLSDITPQDCRDVQQEIKKGSGSPSSVNRIMSTASKLFRLACEEGILDRNPMQFVKMLKEPPPRSRLLTAEEKERLWQELHKDTLLFRLVTLAVNLPLRRGQLLAITPNAIDLQTGQLFTTASKGRMPRLVPLNTIALNTLQAMMNDKQLPFPLKDFRRRWKRILISAKVNTKDGKRGENFTFHDLRKELATELMRRNNNAKTVQHLFGHSDMSITDIYIQAEFEQMREALNSLDDTILTPTQETNGPPN